MSFDKFLTHSAREANTLLKKQRLPLFSRLNWFRRNYGIVTRCPAQPDLDVCPLWPSCDCCPANLDSVSKRDLLGRLAAYDFDDHMYDFASLMRDYFKNKLDPKFFKGVDDMLRWRSKEREQDRRNEDEGD
ncbi:MAG: hypothetical protein [Microviridae sp.]|nr:MAG: hypothetical protein [Microviridae sp.]AXQ65901.1 MAG: hypothetical protein [Microviridae sp.]